MALPKEHNIYIAYVTILPLQKDLTVYTFSFLLSVGRGLPSSSYPGPHKEPNSCQSNRCKTVSLKEIFLHLLLEARCISIIKTAGIMIGSLLDV